MAILYKYTYAEPGYYRVYYKSTTNPKHLYCLQNDGAWGEDKFVFYTCSRDGEPDSPIRMPLGSSFDQLVWPDSIVKKEQKDDYAE